MPSLWPDSARAQIVAAVGERLCKRRASAFSEAGEGACVRHVEAGLAALEADLAAGKTDAVRTFVYALLDELCDVGLSFSDLRFYINNLRREVVAALESGAESEGDDPGLGLKIERWFFELLSVCTMRFMAWRDEQTRLESARLGVERLESQLAELELVLHERTELLELIRQASTPIAPVVRGILVVPLVGTFDAFRAELLTERLLQEIARTQARATILDISGVPVFDTAAAQLMIRLARSVRLLGSQALVVGMSPANATTLVGLGIDLGHIQTHATLQDGLARALKLQGLQITRRGP